MFRPDLGLTPDGSSTWTPIDGKAARGVLRLQLPDSEYCVRMEAVPRDEYPPDRSKLHVQTLKHTLHIFGFLRILWKVILGLELVYNVNHWHKFDSFVLLEVLNQPEESQSNPWDRRF